MDFPGFLPGRCYLKRTDVIDGIEEFGPLADLIVTSPPYNVGKSYDSSEDAQLLPEYLFWFEKWILALYRKTKSRCRLVVNVPSLIKGYEGGEVLTYSVNQVLFPLFFKVGWKLRGEVIWSKYGGKNEERPAPGTAWGSFGSPSAPSIRTHTERIWFWYKEEWKISPPGPDLAGEIIDRRDFAQATHDIWTIHGESHRKHPAVMAKEVARRAILLCSYPRAFVYDPFSGSGTVPIQAALNDRVGVGTDLSGSYIKISQAESLGVCVPTYLLPGEDARTED